MPFAKKTMLLLGLMLLAAPSFLFAQVAVTTDKSYQSDVVDSKRPVLIDFWATWCGPCRIYGPVVDQVAKEYGGKLKVCRVNVDDNPALSPRFNVTSIPASFVVQKGKVVKSWVGALPLSEVQDRLKPLFSAPN